MIHNGHFDSHDDVLAHRLMLAAISDDENAFDTVMAELGCTHCSHRMIYALVDWLLCSLLSEQCHIAIRGGNPPEGMFERAARDIEDRLADRLDDRWPDGAP
jgi:hypothetical protein